MRRVKTVCTRDCYDTCFLVAVIDSKGKIKSLKGESENPITQGFLCPRGVKDNEQIYRNRVLFPHFRFANKPSRKFKKVTWDEALDLVADKLQEVLTNYGSEAVLHLEYAGNMGLLTWYFPQRIWNAIGATKTDYSICSKSGHESIALHYGLSYGILPEDILKMRLIVFWGFNAAISSQHLWALTLKAKENGAVVGVVDPRKTESTRKADIWLNPRPGSDVVLAFGVIRCIIEHGYADLDFIDKWTFGYELLKKEIFKWSPKKVEEVTGVKWSLIEDLGSAYGELKPNTTMIGLGFQKSIFGAESVRAVALIPALIGLHRGFYYGNSKGWMVDIQYLTGKKLLSRKPKVVSQVALGRYLERGDFKFIYIYNMNPVLTLPDQTAFRNGLLRKDIFTVLHESHWTETADYADVVLPAPTYLEKDDIVLSYSHPYVRISKKVISPLGESKDEIWVMKKLAEKLNLKEEWIFEDPWKALERAFKNTLTNGSFKDLAEGATLKLKYRPLNEYQTPTKKIEFYSKKAEELGLSPLPKQYLLKLKEDEFILLNSSTLKYTHTQFQEVYGPIPPIVYINPDDAKFFGVENNEVIELYNELGRTRIRAKVSADVPKRVLWSPKQFVGLCGRPQNILVPCLTQEIGGGPIFNSTIVRIKKLNI